MKRPMLSAGLALLLACGSYEGASEPTLGELEQPQVAAINYGWNAADSQARGFPCLENDNNLQCNYPPQRALATKITFDGISPLTRLAFADAVTPVLADANDAFAGLFSFPITTGGTFDMEFVDSDLSGNPGGQINNFVQSFCVQSERLAEPTPVAGAYVVCRRIVHNIDFVRLEEDFGPVGSTAWVRRMQHIFGHSLVLAAGIGGSSSSTGSWSDITFFGETVNTGITNFERCLAENYDPASDLGTIRLLRPVCNF